MYFSLGVPMIVLDCETRETTLQSISDLYGSSVTEIGSYLANFDFDALSEEESHQYHAHVNLKQKFDCQFGKPAQELERVYWFHLTRTLADTNFEQGILPLEPSLEWVWHTISAIFANTEHAVNIDRLHTEGVSNFEFGLKLSNPVYGGPFAMLIREVAFRADEIKNHDYLKIPEIMEDICNDYFEKFDVRIHEVLSAGLVPRIVKFWSDQRCGEDCIQAALYYLHLSANGLALDANANTCFDGNNQFVPFDQITNVVDVGQSKPLPAST
jgi:hypothetical protein